MQEDIFDSAYNVDNDDHEKTSYGKAAYKRVQRLRRKGQRRGIEVPRLGYALTKPDKPRVAFSVVAVISAVLFAGIIVGIGFLYNELVKTFSDLNGIGEFIKTMFKPDIFRGSFGTSALPAALMIAVYLLIVLLFAVPIIAAIYFYRFVRDAFYMAKCSKEEFAKGGLVVSRIFAFIVIIATVTVIYAVLSAYTTSASAKLYAGLIFGGLVLALGGMVVLMIFEKIKCGKWFDDLDENKKRDYLAHERALRRVKSRLRTEKRIWNDLGK